MEVNRAKRTQSRIKQRLELTNINDDVDAVDDEEEEDVAAAANEEETVNTSDSDEEINRLNASSSSLAAAATVNNLISVEVRPVPRFLLFAQTPCNY